ncbi:MAG: class I SAM-dependent methyltransferase [Tepidiformaceae bacterium]
MTAQRQSAFDAVAETYDRVRPSYPEPLFDDLFTYLDGPASPAVCEIGAGTGKATASLLRHGAHVTAIELGPNMATFLRTKFVGETRLEVLTGAFEEVLIEPHSFDLVLSATAFHWLDPSSRLTKSHAVLRAGGALAVIDTNQVASDADRGFFERCQPIYDRYYPGESHTAAAGPDITPPAFVEILKSALFDDVRLWRYPWDQHYSTSAYADLVMSYSNTQSLPSEQRDGLVADLCALIDAEFGGEVTRPLVVTLVTGRTR